MIFLIFEIIDNYHIKISCSGASRTQFYFLQHLINGTNSLSYYKLVRR